MVIYCKTMIFTISCLKISYSKNLFYYENKVLLRVKYSFNFELDLILKSLF